MVLLMLLIVKQISATRTFDVYSTHCVLPYTQAHRVRGLLSTSDAADEHLHCLRVYRV